MSMKEETSAGKEINRESVMGSVREEKSFCDEQMPSSPSRMNSPSPHRSRIQSYDEAGGESAVGAREPTSPGLRVSFKETDEVQAKI